MEVFSQNSNLGPLFSFVKYLPLRTPWGYDENDLETYSNSTIISKLTLLLFGVACIVIGSLSFFFEDKQRRAMYLQYLILLQIIQAFFLHMPFVEPPETERYSRELKEFWLILGVTSGVVMMLSFRD